MKTLREISMIRAPQITNAIMNNKVCYVYSGENILFILNCDGLLGFTGSSITVRQGHHAISYDNIGVQRSIATIR